jgi:hypothetical protein
MKYFRKLLRAEFNSVHSKNAIRTLIEALLCHARPSAIRWIVTQFVIPSFKRCSWRPISHVQKKIIELHPCFTHRDPSATVIFPFWSIWFCAPSDHGYPAVVGSGWVCILGVTVSYFPRHNDDDSIVVLSGKRRQQPALAANLPRGLSLSTSETPQRPSDESWDIDEEEDEEDE